MADNYLEKQREAYEARKAAWLQAKKLGKKKAIARKPRVDVHDASSHQQDKKTH